jgi:hypothetical protein
MKGLMEDLASRKKRFAETPPDEIKYWFEFPGPLQVGTLCMSSIFFQYFIICILYIKQGSNIAHHVWGLDIFFINRNTFIGTPDPEAKPIILKDVTTQV